MHTLNCFATIPQVLKSQRLHLSQWSLLYPNFPTHPPELHHDGQGGGDDDAERDEEADCEEEQVIAQVIPLTPGRGAAEVFNY